MASKSWILQPRYSSYENYNTVEIFIDDTFETVDHVEGLKTTLYPHQKPVVKAMMDLEMNRTFQIKEFAHSNDIQFDVTTSAGVLSEAVGSGKTIDVLSLILLQKIPKVIPDIANIDMYKSRYGRKSCYTSIVRRKFKNILQPTIIFTGVSVVDQWVSAIKTFTSLKFFTVFDVRGLQKLIDIMSNKRVNHYDIIIVKNGKVTRPIIFPDHITVEAKNVRSTLHIYNVIANMRNFCWARTVIDDFDTIRIPYNAGIVNSLFTWYISSTRKPMPNKTSSNNQFTTTADMLMYSNYNCGNIIQNHTLFYNLNIRNSVEFVRNTNNISSPKFFAYVFVNPNNQYMGFLGLMDNDEANEIMEMLNGDAVETAAERLGIKTTRVSDIFELMLGKQYDKYKKSIGVLEFIREVEPMQGRRIPMSENPDPDDTYKKSDIFIRRDIKYNYPNLKGLLESTKDEYTEIKKVSSFAIERVKNNIKEGDCPICSGDLNDDEEEILIVKCCGVILCGICCFGTVFPKGEQTGRCSNCRSDLNLKSLIYLNSEFDLSKIVEEKLIDDNVACIDNTEKKEPEAPRSKMVAILEIIKGIVPGERRRVDVSIPNLMKGTHLPPDMSYNKVLIFANYDETIKNIKNTLDDEKVVYWKLGGTHREITETVALFTNYKKTCVLIINSTKHCAGLNLQTATDLIFAHKIIDPNIETQVIGRGQRLGRTSRLRVHFMMYQNEFDWMLRYNTIREIPDTDETDVEVLAGIFDGLESSQSISNGIEDVSDSDY
jgi:hypothetical protein